MSNTADRWWVRLIARWLARVDGVKAHIQVVSLGVTAFSTFSLVLQNSGHGELVVPLGIAGIVGMPIYTYLYTEGGVWNQVSRDRTDLSTNYSGPTMLMDAQIQRAQFAFVLAEIQDRDFETVNEELQALTEEQWQEYRTGVTLEKP